MTQPATTSARWSIPAPNVEPGDVIALADGRQALVTSRVERGGPLAALLEVVVAPSDAPTRASGGRSDT